MKDISRYEPPKESMNDHGHALVSAGMGSLPMIGSAAVELFQTLVTPPLERREWIDAVAQGLKQLEEKQRCVIEELSSNNVFIDTVMMASQAAIRTS